MLVVTPRGGLYFVPQVRRLGLLEDLAAALLGGCGEPQAEPAGMELCLALEPDRSL